MTIRSPYVLLADDDPDDREFFCAGMQRLYPEVSVLPFADGDELSTFLDRSGPLRLPDCIWLDYRMPHSSAPQLLRATGPGTRYDHIPKIVWSTSKLSREMDECLRLGAVHFAIKPETNRQLDDLLRSMEKWIVRRLRTVPVSKANSLPTQQTW
jgi:CheY-like chemotaxis protein